MRKSIHIGIDVGSISIKICLLAHESSIIKNVEDSALNEFFQKNTFRLENTKLPYLYKVSHYLRHQGKPKNVIQEFASVLNKSRLNEFNLGICFTGTGGKTFESHNDQYQNSFKSVVHGVQAVHPEVKTIFELGGEKSKYIRFENKNGRTIILDYENNGECAAGTGSFFDQQLNRLHYKIEDVSSILKDVKRPASIAGRCSVFAKSDMIHAQQCGYQPKEVLKGLCEAVVRNYKATITKGKAIEQKVALVGGMSMNQGIVDSIRSAFQFTDGELVVDPLNPWMGAIGAAVLSSKKDNKIHPVSEIQFANAEVKYPHSQPLKLEKVKYLKQDKSDFRFSSEKIDAFLGIDVGSVSTNLALMDSDGHLIHGIYTVTRGRPIEVVKESIKKMKKAIPENVIIKGVGTTGSGRELVGSFIGADIVKDEITSHKTGSVFYGKNYLNKKVDTIFEIGGQDSKFISIKDDVVIDFALNDACAAGTGSFLEEQATEMGISIKEEFSGLALRSKKPLKLGERCTVFMEKELVPYLYQGVPKEDIAAGLAYSIAYNYLNRVVKKRKIGDHIFFQGGTAYNKSVAAAFATILDKDIIIPPHNGIMGAIGVSLLAKKWAQKNKKTSRFRGWKVDEIEWTIREFICKSCTNHCNIQEFTVNGEKSYWGDKCSEKYRKRIKYKNKVIISDLIKYYHENLFGDGEQDDPKVLHKNKTIGIPRSLYFYDRLPFWKTYFKTLGYTVQLSKPTQRRQIEMGLSHTVADPCFPIQVAHGHILEFAENKPDYILVPNTINEEDESSSVASFLCPWGQTLPLVAMHTPALAGIKNRILSPNTQFRMGQEFVEERLFQELLHLGIDREDHKKAIQKAYQKQKEFRETIQEKGKEILQKIQKEKHRCIVLLGRPYNLFDSGLNLNIPYKLRNEYGVDVVPMDYLPLARVEIRDIHDHMFWNYGRKIIQAARFVRDYENMNIIYISNFKCGPDSYIRHFIEEACGKPFLFLQFDSHANDAGALTRIEAFLQSKNMI